MNRSLFIRRRLGSRGASSIEFTFISMAGLGLLLCGLDLVNYARSRLKLDEVSSSLASLVTGYKDLYASDFTMMYQVSQQMAGGQDVTRTGGATIFTGIASLATTDNPSGAPRVMWRQQSPTVNPAFPSALGSVGFAPTNMPDGYVVPFGSSVIAVEVFGSVHPWVLSEAIMKTTGQPTLGSLTIFQPRSALLSTVSSGQRP